MSWKKIAIVAVLADFAALTTYAVAQVGYAGFFAQAFSNVVGITIAADLFIALGLVLLWMVRDAREHGVAPLPFVLLTLALGSIGPLAYLLRCPDEAGADGPLAREV